MISIWEKRSFLEVDVLILGAGITGLSAAASLKERDPSLRVTVLEKGILPTGASTKNAGFACFGSATELLSDVQVLGVEGMLALVRKRWQGLQKTIDRLGAEAIDLQRKSGYELIFEQNDPSFQLDHLNQQLLPIFKEDVFQQVDAKIATYGFGGTKHLIENKFEGQLDTGKLIDGLWQYCSQLGIRIHTGFEATKIEADEDCVRVLSDTDCFVARKVGLCTNAFTKQFLGELDDLHPGRGTVLLIQPENELEFEGTFHYDEGYYYFRDYYGKLIFGGGRNLDFESEETTEFGINQKIKEKLLMDLREIILPDQGFQVEMEWSGIMAFGATKEPVIRKVSEHIAVGARLGGMGVAIGSLVGEEVASLLLK